VDLVADYWESLDGGQRKPMPDVQPGFLRSLIPEDPPEEPEKWEQILRDVEPIVLRGNTHWWGKENNRQIYPILGIIQIFMHISQRRAVMPVSLATF
jgi:hypothetical protein